MATHKVWRAVAPWAAATVALVLLARNALPRLIPATADAVGYLPDTQDIAALTLAVITWRYVILTRRLVEAPVQEDRRSAVRDLREIVMHDASAVGVVGEVLSSFPKEDFGTWERLFVPEAAAGGASDSERMHLAMYALNRDVHRLPPPLRAAATSLSGGLEVAWSRINRIRGSMLLENERAADAGESPSWMGVEAAWDDPRLQHALPLAEVMSSAIDAESYFAVERLRNEFLAATAVWLASEE